MTQEPKIIPGKIVPGEEHYYAEDFDGDLWVLRVPGTDDYVQLQPIYFEAPWETLYFVSEADALEFKTKYDLGDVVPECVPKQVH